MIGDDLTDEQIDYMLRVLRENSPGRYRRLQRIDYRQRGLVRVNPASMPWRDGFIDQEYMDELAGY